ncbi:hypothetical protein APE01nite_09910 [Acetobacter peroxydans]|uniref:Uncharacterized protein n=1 Tax=Acetobacter peroxydans TaxID=104098 RepID=A0A4Y3TTX6_9PROT|nr:hypothetical protein APE01nite_09910 [Acetobacter peroxydans]
MCRDYRSNLLLVLQALAFQYPIIYIRFYFLTYMCPLFQFTDDLDDEMLMNRLGA